MKHFTIEHDQEDRIPFIDETLGKHLPPFTCMVRPGTAGVEEDDNDMLHGGKLKPEVAPRHRPSIFRHTSTYEKAGIPIWGVTLQNEPMATQVWEL